MERGEVAYSTFEESCSREWAKDSLRDGGTLYPPSGRCRDELTGPPTLPGVPAYRPPQGLPDYRPPPSLPYSGPKVAYAAEIEQLGLRGFLEQVRERSAAFSTLSLAENAIGDAGAHVLCDIMSDNPVLCRLNLHDTGLGCIGFGKVGDLLQTCDQIETLVMSGNRFNSTYLPDPFCIAVGTAPSLRALQLSGCDLTESAVTPLFESLCRRCAVGLHPLDRLNLSRNRLTGTDAAELCGLLLARGQLDTMDLSHNALGPAGGEVLVQRILGAVSCRLRRLSVDANGLEVRGCRAMARLWNSSVGQCLDHLDLRENGTTEANCKELCRMVGKELGTVLRFENGRRVMLSWRERQGAMNRKAHGGHEPLNVYWHD